MGAYLASQGQWSFGGPEEKPEFSDFSWFSMIFGAGLGVGLMIFCHGRTIKPLGIQPGRLGGRSGRQFT
ncbi:BCCT family transporter [Shimia sp. R11_0]|nr:BCCT family transporter [Shimia sp. R11_0]